MAWLFFALLYPLLHAFSNVIDSFLINKCLKNETETILFYSNIFKALFLGILFILIKPELLPLSHLFHAVTIGIISVVYLFPYYKALSKEDASIVAALFSLGKVFVPVLAFFIIGEMLQLHQYIGFVVIIVASALLSLKSTKRKIYLNNTFFYMIISSFLISLQAVLYKDLILIVSWVDSFLWASLFTCLSIFLLPISKRVRTSIALNFNLFKQRHYLFFLKQLVVLSAWASFAYAAMNASVTVIKGIASLQPFLVLMIAALLTPYCPKFFREDLQTNITIKKIGFFVIMLLGIILTYI